MARHPEGAESAPILASGATVEREMLLNTNRNHQIWHPRSLSASVVGRAGVHR